MKEIAKLFQVECPSKPYVEEWVLMIDDRVFALLESIAASLAVLTTPQVRPVTYPPAHTPREFSPSDWRAGDSATPPGHRDTQTGGKP